MNNHKVTSKSSSVVSLPQPPSVPACSSTRSDNIPDWESAEKISSPEQSWWTALRQSAFRFCNAVSHIIPARAQEQHLPLERLICEPELRAHFPAQATALICNSKKPAVYYSELRNKQACIHSHMSASQSMHMLAVSARDMMSASLRLGAKVSIYLCKAVTWLSASVTSSSALVS